MPEFFTVGDYARQLVQRRQNADIRARMDELVQEVGSGRKADLARELRGDFTSVASFEADLKALAAYEISARELATRAETTQLALGAVQTATKEFAGELLTVQEGNLGVLVRADEARARFEQVVSTLNGTEPGRRLFAGVATDGPALAPAEDMLAALEAIVAAAPDIAAAEADLRAWFAPGGGFDTLGYLGAVQPIPPQTVGPGETIELSVTAEDEGLRDVLAGLALAALSGAGPAAGDTAGQVQLLRSAGSTLHARQKDLSELRGAVGLAERGTEEALTRIEAQRSALERARAELVEADVYDAASELEAVQGQLELLYAITARSARLTLVNAL
jgi:flagellar hook-associated protein 3 FlgL